jgi:hypothetical protein
LNKNGGEKGMEELLDEKKQVYAKILPIRTAIDRSKHANKMHHNDMENLRKSNFFEVPFEMNMMKDFSNLFDSNHFIELQNKLMIHPKHVKGRRVLKIEVEI